MSTRTPALYLHAARTCGHSRERSGHVTGAWGPGASCEVMRSTAEHPRLHHQRQQTSISHVLLQPSLPPLTSRYNCTSIVLCFLESPFTCFLW